MKYILTKEAKTYYDESKDKFKEYIKKMQDDFKLGGFISIVSIIIIYIFITNRVMVVGGAFYATLFAINHIGVFYFFSMMIAGEKTNEILRYLQKS